MPKTLGFIHTSHGTTTSSTSTSFTEVVESAALVAGKTYYVVCTALIEGSNTANVFEYRLFDNTNNAEVTDSVVKREPANGIQTQSYQFIGKITAGSNGGGLSFEQKAADGYTVTTQYLSMWLLELDDLRSSDYFFESNSTQAEHTDSYVDRVTKTVQKTKAGDEWLVLGWGSFSMDSVTKAAAMTLSYTNGGSTSAEPEIVFEGEDLTEILPGMVARAYTIGTSGVSEWKLQSKDPSLHASTPNDYEAGALLGIRLNAFADFDSSYNTSNQTWDLGEVTFKEIQSASLKSSQAGGVFAIGFGVLDTNTSSGSHGAFSRLQVEGSSTPNSVPDNERQCGVNDPVSDRMPLVNISVYTGAANVTKTIDWDVSRTRSNIDMICSDATIAVFSSELAYDSPTVTGKMRRPGVFRRGNGRTSRKRFRK